MSNAEIEAYRIWETITSLTNATPYIQSVQPGWTVSLAPEASGAFWGKRSTNEHITRLLQHDFNQ